MARTMPEEHESRLRRIAALFGPNKEPLPLPDNLVEAYWNLKFCADRIQMPLTDNDLVRTCVDCGFGMPTAEQTAGPSILTLWKQKKVGVDTPITCKWRGKPATGKLVRVTDDGRVFAVVDHEERELKVADVAVATGA